MFGWKPRPKYSDHLDYLVASIVYLATQRGWWARTPQRLAAELSLDEARLRTTFENFPGIFRKSTFTDNEGSHFYALQARYALRSDYQTQEREVDVPPLPIETTRLIYEFVLRAADDERTAKRTWIANLIAVLAAIVAAASAVAVALVKGS